MSIRTTQKERVAALHARHELQGSKLNGRAKRIRGVFRGPVCWPATPAI